MTPRIRHTSHAYIIEGTSDTLAAANAYAKALQCEGDAGQAACGACLSCRVFESGNHPDVLYVTGAKTSSVGVDDVRGQIIAQMASKPFMYRYKIFIIDKAETLTPAAQNALLKTIEEPAPYGVFLLLANQVENMLPTVVSRCVVVREKETAALFGNHDEDLTALARDIINKTGTRQADILQALGLYKLIEPYKESKESVQTLLDMLYMEYGRLIRGGDYRLTAAAKAVAAAKEALSQNANLQLAIEVLMLRLNGSIAV
jgi:DNA polymerase III delta prime subunit